MKLTSILLFICIIFHTKAEGQFYNNLFKVYNKNEKLSLIETLDFKLSFYNKHLTYAIDNDTTFFYDAKKANLVILQKDTINNKFDTLLLHITNNQLSIIDKNKIRPILFTEINFLNKLDFEKSTTLNVQNYTWGDWIFSSTQSTNQNFKLSINNIKKIKYIELIRNKVSNTQKRNLWRIEIKKSENKIISFYAPNIGVISFSDEKYTVLMFGKKEKNIFRSIDTQLKGKYMYVDSNYQLRYNTFGKINMKKSRGIKVIDLPTSVSVGSCGSCHRPYRKVNFAYLINLFEPLHFESLNE